MRIAVISDTHNFLDPKIPAIFAGADHILHAGDIGLPRIILDLEQIAPVTAVLGNTDEPALGFRDTETLELSGRKFLLHHIVNPLEVADTIKERIDREGAQVIIFGHTHKPFCQTIDGRLYFNPGYAGKSRFGMERTVAILDCNKSGLRHRYFTL